MLTTCPRCESLVEAEWDTDEFYRGSGGPIQLRCSQCSRLLPQDEVEDRFDIGGEG